MDACTKTIFHKHGSSFAHLFLFVLLCFKCILLLCVRVSLSQAIVNHFSVWCPQTSEEGIRPLEAEFHIIVSWEQNLGPL